MQRCDHEHQVHPVVERCQGENCRDQCDDEKRDYGEADYPQSIHGLQLRTWQSSSQAHDLSLRNLFDQSQRLDLRLGRLEDQDALGRVVLQARPSRRDLLQLA